MSPRHDPTDEAETLPGIPKAGSDLEQFPSVPGLLAGGGFNIDVAIQEITAVLVGTTVTVVITAVADLTRAYLQIQGSSFGIPSVGGDENGLVHTNRWEFTSTSTVKVSRNTGGGSMTLKIAVIEFI
jgi:hypothetical protein